jgi:hypothetical protein
MFIVKALAENLNVDARRIYAISLAAGSTTMWNTILANPGVFAAYVSTSTDPYNSYSTNLNDGDFAARAKIAEDKYEQLLNDLPGWSFYGFTDRSGSPISGDPLARVKGERARDLAFLMNGKGYGIDVSWGEDGELMWNGMLRGKQAEAVARAQLDRAAASGAGTLVTLFIPGTVLQSMHWAWMAAYSNAVTWEWLYTHVREDAVGTASIVAPAPQYIITFDPNNGAVSTSETTGPDGRLSSLPELAREYFAFDGWFTAADGGAQVTADTVFGADTVVYAHWTHVGDGAPEEPGASPTPGAPEEPGASPTPGAPEEPVASPTPGGQDGPEGTATAAPAAPTASGGASGGGGGGVSSSGGGSSTASPKPGGTQEPAPGTGDGAGGGDGGGGGAAGGWPRLTVGGATSALDGQAGSTALPEGGVIEFEDGAKVDAPAGTVVRPDGSATVPLGAVATLRAADGKAHEVPGGFTIVPDGAAPLGFAFRFDNPFSDVAEGDWFYGDVAYDFLNGLFLGTGIDKFDPQAPLTRGMLVTVLGRMHGVDAAAYAGQAFLDVPVAEYYAPYVAWGKENGVVLGVGEGRYEPDRMVQRQEMVAIFTRYLAYIGKALPETRVAVAFDDAGQIDGWALPSAESMYRAGIVNGVGGNRFAPLDDSMRAEAAAILHRLAAALGLGYLEPSL